VKNIESKPWYLKKNQIDNLYDLLIDQRRWLSVIVLSQPEETTGSVTGYVVDENILARSVFGVAHVVCLPMELEILWASKVERSWAVGFNSARIYYPNLDFQKHSPRNHPIFYPPTPDKGNPELFVMSIIKTVMEYNLNRKIDWNDWIFYSEAKTIQAKYVRQQLIAKSEQQLATKSDKMVSIDKFSELKSQLVKMEGVQSEAIVAL
jgi:hypothetical protein